ncbi:MAG: M23 family metallopeptidase [Desulfobacterales bacterium]|nr:M23 family metallopeptidase [Desulfobacterales bacterium]
MRSKKNGSGTRFKYGLLTILCLVMLAGALWLLIAKFEGKPPVINLEMADEYIAADAQIPVSVKDSDSGIRKVWIALMQEGEETVLREQTWEAGATLTKDGKRSFSLEVKPGDLGFSDGEALLRVAVWDHSWRSWFSGNRAYTEKDLVIDTVSPRVEVLTRQHNIRQGGSCLLIYRLSEACKKHGVSVDGHFFPGYSGYFDDPDVYLSFFGVGHDQPADAEMHVRAVDRAGNSARTGFHYYLGKGRFDAERLNISGQFLRKILPEFRGASGMPEDADPVKLFLFVNQELRRRNNQTILSAAGKTDTRLHWSGAFTRLPNSARKASFADRRTYVHKGEVIDKKVHLGIDLASTRQAQVPAANAGRVTFVGQAGIYGNVVTIDHGFGLFSVYAHLSRSLVEEGQMVNQSDVIGYTGSTGLAGGDHLHFGMFIQEVFVNPVEWWDGSWIQNNVAAKLEYVRGLLSRE